MTDGPVGSDVYTFVLMHSSLAMLQVASGSGDMRRALESCSRAFAALCQDAASAEAERCAAVDALGAT